jgi:hypothetical protein
MKDNASNIILGEYEKKEIVKLFFSKLFWFVSKRKVAQKHKWN